MSARTYTPYTPVCPSITPFSPLAEIDAWIVELERMAQAAPDDEGLSNALDSARRMRADVTANPLPEFPQDGRRS